MRPTWRAALLLATEVPLLPIAPPSSAIASERAEERIVHCRRPPACWVTAFAIRPDGTEIFYVERFSGEIRRFELSTGTDTRWARIRDVAGKGEQGVLGIALDPDWMSGPSQRRVFVYYTEEHPQRNKIVRLRRGADGLRRKVLVTVPGETHHNGGVLHFGPDHKLYAVTGDAGSPSRAQAVHDLAGKVLRMREDGNRPGDNPLRSRAFSFGHRNSFGFAWDPATGSLWQTENGPGCDDEINLVLPGRNYGWGEASDCPGTSESGHRPAQPKIRLNPPVAPTGAAFCDGCGLGDSIEGDLIVGTFNNELMYALDLNSARDDITGKSILLRRRDAVLAVEAAPDGTIYFSDVRGIYRVSR